MTSKNFNMSFDPEIRQQFAELVASYGLTVPQAFKLFANQSVQTGVLPLSFDYHRKTDGLIPNTETHQAILEGRQEYLADQSKRYKTVDEVMQSMADIYHG